MLTSTIALMREHGVAGASLDAVLAHSRTPRGSVYHYFPGGRNEMIIDATRAAGDFIASVIEQTDHTDPRRAFGRFVDLWKQVLTDSDFRAGCPILAVAVDGGRDLPGAMDLTREIFTAWQDKISARLTANGMPDERARRLATLAIAAIEGAVILCRVQRSADPLDDVAEELSPLFT
ncbi:TetR/AcrR family transcriptional regulator [Actinosynnema sp. ALI-1.44]|uniref:TetR/AcrR family transcriptional regulator n=1 Tax=Actinosynnema sp. ALI-1.44 TaxID=1933779 RepID=UPI001EDC6A27|nr:TetR/AcrR family transcriptional regulator [Actinosynnema sp. ALI-1.44]